MVTIIINPGSLVDWQSAVLGTQQAYWTWNRATLLVACFALR